MGVFRKKQLFTDKDFTSVYMSLFSFRPIFKILSNSVMVIFFFKYFFSLSVSI